ncbi:MAG: DsrE family protein [Candidatus Verstraetearchaeota archaeon]|nr:DsrE family protein [Candidatus Verstraetearchaeota archaeon]
MSWSEENKNGKEGKQRILYILSSGPDAPERVYIPFILALIAVATGLEPSIYFIVKGVGCLRKGVPEKVRLGSFPTLKEMIEEAASSGVKLFACSRSCKLMGLEPRDLIDGAVEVEGEALNELMNNADGVIYF